MQKLWTPERVVDTHRSRVLSSRNMCLCPDFSRQWGESFWFLRRVHMPCVRVVRPLCMDWLSGVEITVGSLGCVVCGCIGVFCLMTIHGGGQSKSDTTRYFPPPWFLPHTLCLSPPQPLHPWGEVVAFFRSTLVGNFGLAF